VTAPREHRQETPEGDICWFEWGDPGEGASVLLLHATGFHARLWDRVVAALPAGTHVVAPDHRGHGRSFRPESLSDWTGNARALLPLLDHFGRRSFVGCGHSMGGYVLTRLAAERADAFRHLILIDPVIMAPGLYAGQADQPVPEPADHPVSRRRNQWASVEEMRARFADRSPYSGWEPAVLDDYCTYGLLPASSCEGLELACPPTLEASMYQNALRTDPYAWLADLKAPATLIRAPQGLRGDTMDFSQSPTWPGLGPVIGAAPDELWSDHSHFIPMEAPARVAGLIAAAL